MTDIAIFWLAELGPLLSRGLATAIFVGSVIWLMERCSPFIGGIVLALPIVTAPAYVVLVLHHDAAFVAAAARGGLGTIGGVLLFITAVIALTPRWPMPVALGAGLLVWLGTGMLVRALPAGLPASLGLLAVAALIAWLAGRRVSLTAPAARSRSPFYEILLRGAAAGLLVIGVSILAAAVGPQVAGIASAFPVALLTVCWFLPRRLDAAGIRAALRATQVGMASHLPFLFCLALLGPRLAGTDAAGGTGDFTAFILGVAGSLAVAILLALLRRRHLGQASRNP